MQCRKCTEEKTTIGMSLNLPYAYETYASVNAAVYVFIWLKTGCPDRGFAVQSRKTCTLAFLRFTILKATVFSLNYLS